MAEEKTLKVQKIKEGTVIDHIDGGKAWDVIRLLGLEDYPDTVTVLANSPSKKMGKKDVVKVENKQLVKAELDKVALIAPHASVNFIKDFEVKEKYNVKVPKEVVGLLKCTNPACVTHDEPVTTRYSVESEDPLKLRCAYCERVQSGIEFEE